jgi:prepilin-type N-terminal cleavage/methylation domain-containing protein
MKRTQGFTLLEVLVATMIMAFAVVGLLGALHTSLRNAARLTDHDRMAMLARAKMDELLVDYNEPLEAELDGVFNPAATGGEAAGFHVSMSVFEAPPQPAPGSPILQRIALHIWWTADDRQRTMDLEAYRRNTLPQAVQP